MSWGSMRLNPESADVPLPDEQPEVGSEAWVKAELAAGRSGEELDRPYSKNPPNGGGASQPPRR